MKKILLLVFILGTCAEQLLAQEKIVSGKVTSAEDGSPLPGVTVILKGTTNGTITDGGGDYKISIPVDGEILTFSFVGFKSYEVEIGSKSTIDVVLEPDVTQLSEVVVTGLGISREQASLGYSVQEVQGNEVNMVGENNVVSALSGKVAGVQIIGSSSAALGGSTKIRLRGATSLGETSPLFVVDGTPITNQSIGPSGRTHYSGARDFGNLAQDINPDDIESISVLKGPSATAIYGQRGANGVILITTKKGKQGSGIGVNFNNTTTFEQVYILPEYQNEYAGGYDQQLKVFTYNPASHPASWASFDGHRYLNYNADESWGPKIDGTPIRHWWSWYEGPEFGELAPLEAHPDNVRNFFETGVTINNNVSVSGGNELGAFRMSTSYTTQDGVLPNTELDRAAVSFNGSVKLSEKVSSAINVNYTNTQGKNRPVLGYGTGPVSSFNQWFQRQLDMDRLRDYKNPDGSQRFWNIRVPEIEAGSTPTQPLYWNNPFWDLYEDGSDDNRDRVFGNVSVTYSVLDNLKISGFLRTDSYTQRIEEWIASGGLNIDDFTERVYQGREHNYEFLAEHNTNLGEISLNTTLGGNIRKNFFSLSSASTSGGLSTPNYFDIAASVDRPVVDTYREEKEVRSLYGSISFGYKDFLYLDITGRNDWSSALPQDNNSYFYPSVSASVILSEVIDVDMISFAKLRVGWAQIGSDIDPYNIYQTFSVGDPYGSNASLFVNNTLLNSELTPQLSSSIEGGIDIRFLQDRIGLDFTYYKNNVTDQILTLTVPGSSGYNSAVVNAGEIESSGMELVLSASPVRSNDFSWDISLNGARNTSEVLKLAEGLKARQLQLILSDSWGGLRLYAEEGEEWGFLVGGGFQTYQATDTNGEPVDDPNNGKRIVSAGGYYQWEPNKDLGSILPDFTGGIRNTFTYKNFNLGMFIDFQKGGQFFSITRMFNAYSGLAKETAGMNDLGNPKRDPVADGGGVHVTDAVLSDGTPFDGYVEAVSYYGNLFGLNENWIYDASFVKLRELRLGYELPASIVNNTPFNKIGFAIVAKNVWLIQSNVDGIDPSEIGEGIGGFNAAEGGVLPGVRSLGFNVKLGL